MSSAICHLLAAEKQVQGVSASSSFSPLQSNRLDLGKPKQKPMLHIIIQLFKTLVKKKKKNRKTLIIIVNDKSNSLLWKEFDVNISHCCMNDRTVRYSSVGDVLHTAKSQPHVSATEIIRCCPLPGQLEIN